MPNLVNDFEVRKETLRALGGNPDGLANIYEVDKEILKILSEGGVGIDWDTIKQKLANDGVESIKFTMGNEEVILTAEEVKNLLNQPVIPEGKYINITVLDGSEGTTIAPTVTGSLPNLNLQYRINGGDWNDFIVGTTADIHAVAGDVVQFKGNNQNGVSIDYYNYLNFAISGNPVALSGNIMSLIDGVGETTVIPNRLCFYYLFYNSFSIKTVSSDFLPATTLKDECYRSLFSYCGNLTQTPELPATTLANGCYGEMFSGCYSLKQAPELPAEVLLKECYNYMFMYCNSLNYVKCLAREGTINEDGTVPSALTDWLSGVPSTGTFVKPDGVVYGTGSDGIPSGWTVKYVDLIEAPKDGKQYARQDGSWTPVEEGITDAPSDGKTYGRNNGNWTTVKEGISDAPSDGTQYARQDGAWVPVQTPMEGKYLTITADESNTGETIIHPNIEGSLPNLNLQYRINNGKWTDFIVGTTADIKIGAGDVLQFKGDNKEGVSNNGISGVNSLNFAISGNPVALSGSVMSLIDGVGDSLVIPNDYCFVHLFRNSAAIKTVSSDFLPATTLKSDCYRDLFSGCTSLTQAPELPATTIMDGCYHGMFYGCKSLVTAPELPAKTLVDSCYGYMFNGSTSLNYVKCLATEGTINGDGTVPSALDNWLQGVASTGTIEKLSGVSYEAGGNGIPEGWTVKEIYEYVEAPMDGQQYARQDGNWAVVEKGILDAPIDGVQYARQDGTWTPVEKGLDWNTIKQKLAGDGVESIKFIIGNEQVILTASEVKTLLNQTVLPDAPSDGKTYGRNNGAWTPVTEGITDSPSDGQQYARQDGTWAVVEKGITDSPSDGKQYARQNGNWTVVESVEPGIPDAPSDSKTYGRNNGAWTPVTEGITDSPSDGQQYARQNGAWAVVEKGISDAPADGTQYARQNGTWTPVEEGLTDAPSDGKQYSRKNGAWVESEPNKVKTTKDTTLQFWSGTQQEYDAIATKDANTLYIIS